MEKKPDYDKLNLLKTIQGKVRKESCIEDLNKGYRAAMNDLNLLDVTNYLTQGEYDIQVKVIQDKYISLALQLDQPPITGSSVQKISE